MYIHNLNHLIIGVHFGKFVWGN